MFIFGQVLAAVSAVCFTISVLQKTRKDLLWCQILNTVAGTTSCIVLGTYAAAVTNCMALLRSVLLRMGKDMKVVMYLIAIATLAISLMCNQKGIIGLLPAFASVEYTIALIYVKEMQAIRIATLINVIPWCIHDWITQMYPFAICDTVNIVILVVALVRRTEEEQGENKQLLSRKDTQTKLGEDRHED